jgi:glycosyltransferase involved in cell wall biosynthesis
LQTLLYALKQHPAIGVILVVDDGSTDGTGEVAKQSGVDLIAIAENRGKGNALALGFAALRDRRGLDAVVTMDADLQHDPDDLDLFLDKRRTQGTNIVLGSRKRWGTRMPLERKLSNAMTSWMVSSRIGFKVPDSQCGYRLIGIEVLNALNVEAAGFEAETELLIKAAKHAFTFSFVNIQTRYDGEKSHMTYWQTTKRFVQTVLKDY